MSLNCNYNISRICLIYKFSDGGFVLESGDLCTAIQSGSGRFELCLNDTIVLSGNIFSLDKLKSNKNTTAVYGESVGSGGGKSIVSLSRDDVYLSLEQYHYNVGDVFKTIRHVDIYEDSMHKIEIILYIITMYQSMESILITLMILT